MRANDRIALIIALSVAIAVSGFMLVRHRSGAALRQVAAKSAPSYWYDPMHPSEHFDKPGKSPYMDMQLVPKYADPAGTGLGDRSAAAKALPGTISVDSRVVQNLGIRLAKAEQGSFAGVIDAVGLVGVDEHRIEAIQVREPGWVEQLGVRAVGDAVRRGQLLAGIYSPDLLATQQEWLIARGSGDPNLIEAARLRLTLFGLSDSQIARIEKSGRVERRIDYYAPFDGYVMELGARQGAAVQPGTTLFQLADLTSVWVIGEVPETQAAWLKPGDIADIEVPARPGERFTGRVDYLYPELTQATRTLKVRVVVKNPNRHLSPGMFAAVHFRSTTPRQILTIPTEAVIQTGARSIVIVAQDESHFRPVLVQIGAEQGGRSEILHGLSVGQDVVASGQFLIDSEANLRGVFDNLAGSNESNVVDGKPMLMPEPTANPSNEGH
jgi:Cu(I)/Ag(I) efflux system membrane fusion protein